jgi:hypothetical protein
VFYLLTMSLLGQKHLFWKAFALFFIFTTLFLFCIFLIALVFGLLPVRLAKIPSISGGYEAEDEKEEKARKILFLHPDVENGLRPRLARR